MSDLDELFGTEAGEIMSEPKPKLKTKIFGWIMRIFLFYALAATFYTTFIICKNLFL